MDAELQFHLDARAHDLIASGLSPDPARRRAREELGDARKWKEAGREARGLRALDALRTDVRQGLWQFRRSPAFAAAAVVSMAIAIGANTAVFSLVNAVVIKRLPVEDPGALVLLGVSSDTQALGSSFPYPFYQELRQATDVMRGVLASASMTPSLEAGDSVERVPGELVSGNYFDVLGVTPYAGRLIVERDEALHAPVVVLDYGYWQRRFGGDPAIVERTIRLDQMPLTVIGITPPAFHGIEPGGAPKLRVPITLQPLMHGGESFLGLSGQWWLQIIGRVRPDISRAQLTDVLGRDYARYRAQQPGRQGLARTARVARRQPGPPDASPPVSAAARDSHCPRRRGADSRVCERRQPDAGAGDHPSARDGLAARARRRPHARDAAARRRGAGARRCRRRHRPWGRGTGEHVR